MAGELQNIDQQTQEDDPFKNLTPRKVLLDPKFHALSPEARKFVLSKVDPAFKGLDGPAQDRALAKDVNYWSSYFAPAPEKNLLEKAKDFLFPEQKPKNLTPPPQTGYGFPVPPAGKAPGLPPPPEEAVTPAPQLLAPPGADKKKHVVLPPDQEASFRSWYSGIAKQTGVVDNPDDPLHKYDYRAAYLTGATPDATGHMPSQFKDLDHPNRYVGGMDTITGKPEHPISKELEDAIRRPGPSETFIGAMPPEKVAAYKEEEAKKRPTSNYVEDIMASFGGSLANAISLDIGPMLGYSQRPASQGTTGEAIAGGAGTLAGSIPGVFLGADVINSAIAKGLSQLPPSVATKVAAAVKVGFSIGIGKSALTHSAAFIDAVKKGDAEGISQSVAGVIVDGAFGVLMAKGYIKDAEALKNEMSARYRGVKSNWQAEQESRFRQAKDITPQEEAVPEPKMTATMQPQISGTQGVQKQLGPGQKMLPLPPAPASVPAPVPEAPARLLAPPVVPSITAGIQSPPTAVPPAPLLSPPGVEQTSLERYRAWEAENDRRDKEIVDKVGAITPEEKAAILIPREPINPNDPESELAKSLEKLSASLPKELPKHEDLKGPFNVNASVVPGEKLPKPESLIEQKTAEETFLKSLGWSEGKNTLDPLNDLGIPHEVVGRAFGTWPEDGVIKSESNYRVHLTDPNATSADAELVAALLGSPHQTAVSIIYEDLGAESHVGVVVRKPDNSKFTTEEVKKIGDITSVGFELIPQGNEIRFTMWNSSGVDDFVHGTISAIKAVGLTAENARGFKGGSYLVDNKDFRGIIERAGNQGRTSGRPSLSDEVLDRFANAFRDAHPKAAQALEDRRRSAREAAADIDRETLDSARGPAQMGDLVSGYGIGTPSAASIGEGTRGGLISPPGRSKPERTVRSGLISPTPPVGSGAAAGSSVSVEDALQKMFRSGGALTLVDGQTLSGFRYALKLFLSPRVNLKGSELPGTPKNDKTLRVFDPGGLFPKDYLRMHAADPAIRNIMGLQSSLFDDWKDFLMDLYPTADFARAHHDGEVTDPGRFASNANGDMVLGNGGVCAVHANSMRQLGWTFALVKNGTIEADEIPLSMSAMMNESMLHELLHQLRRADDDVHKKLLETYRQKHGEFINKQIEKIAGILSADDSKIIRDLIPSYNKYKRFAEAISEIESTGAEKYPSSTTDSFAKTAVEVMARSGKGGLPPPPRSGELISSTIDQVIESDKNRGAPTIEDLERTSAITDLVTDLLGKERIGSEPKARAAFDSRPGSKQYGEVTKDEFKKIYKAAKIKASRLLPGLLPEEQDLLTPADLVRIYEFDEKLTPMIKDFEALSKMGKITRGWYQRAKETTTWLAYHLPGPPKMSPEAKREGFIKLLAALSPQQGVKDNFLMALRTWRLWSDPQSALEEFPDLRLHPDIVPFDKNPEHLKTLFTESVPDWENLPNGNRRYKYERDRRGRILYDFDSETGEKTPRPIYLVKGTVGILARINNTITALSGMKKDSDGNWIQADKLELSGFKVTSFARNIAGLLQYVTLDTHMANMAEIDPKKVAKKGGYLALSNAVRQAAANIGYEPAEQQETAWTVMRALFLLNRRQGIPFSEGLEKITPDLLMEYSANTELAAMLLEDEDVANEIEALGIANAVRKAQSRLKATTKLGRDLSDAEAIDPGIAESIAERSARVAARRADEKVEERRRRGIEEPPSSTQLNLFGAPAPKRGTGFEFGTNEPEPPVESLSKSTGGLVPPPERIGRKNLPEKIKADDLGVPVKNFEDLVSGYIMPDGTIVKVRTHFEALSAATGLRNNLVIPKQKLIAAKYGLIRIKVQGNHPYISPAAEIYDVPTAAQMAALGKMQKEFKAPILYDITEPTQDRSIVYGRGIGDLRQDIDTQFGNPELLMAAPPGGTLPPPPGTTGAAAAFPPPPGHDIIDAFQNASGRSEKTLGEAFRGMFTGRRDVKIAETNQLRDQINKILPDRDDQEALTLYREFHNLPEEEVLRLLNGTHPDYKEYADYLTDENKLKPTQVATKVKEAKDRVAKLAPLFQKALNPSPEMLQAAQLQTDFFRKKLEEGRQNGFLHSSVTPEEYITHILISDYPPDRGDGLMTNAPAGTMPKGFTFAKKRTFGNIVKAVIFDKKPATLNAIDAMTIYGNAHAKVLSTRQFIETLQRNDVLRWGGRKSENIPVDWIPFTKARNKLWEFPVDITDVKGNRVNADFTAYGPRKIVEALYPVTDPNFFDAVKGLQNMRMYQAYIKAVELSLSTFHLKALGLSAVANMGPVETVKAFKMDMESPEFKEQELDGIGQGLTTDIGGRNIEARKRMQSILDDPSFLDKLKDLPVIEQSRQAARWITHQTFGVLQRKFKVADYAAQKAAWLAKNLDAGETETNSALRRIAREVNGVYGGLHWENMGWGKTSTNVFRALLLAPDWTYSNILTAGHAFEGGPAGRAARVFWVASFGIGLALTQAMSLLLSKKMSNNPTKVYFGQDQDGKDVYSNLFFSGGPNDLVNLVNNVADLGLVQGMWQSIAAKAAPLIRYGLQVGSNRDFSGRPIVPKGAGPIAGTARSVWHAATSIGPVPFSVSTPITMLLDGVPHGVPEYMAAVAFAARFSHKVPEGMKEATQGYKKGLLVPAPERTATSIWERITGNRMTVPTLQQFSRMSLDSAVIAYDAADETTRNQYKPFLVRKLKSLPKYNPKARQELQNKLEEFGILRKAPKLPEPPPRPEGLMPPP
jgi:hypothetical protein